MQKGVEGWVEETRLVMGLMGVVWLVSGLLLLVFWKRLPPQVPWFYSLPWGEKQLISKGGMAAVIGGLGVVLSLDGLLAGRLKDREEFLAKMLLWGGLTTAVLLLLSWIKILLIIL